MPKKQQKMASNKKNARKQTHSKIQFYIGICVTTVESFFLLNSTVPIGQCPYENNTFQKGASLRNKFITQAT